MRDKIIESIKRRLDKNEHVHALWLEGADALNRVDEYSDIDFVADVDDSFVDRVFEEVESVLTLIGELDVCENVEVDHDKIFQKVYHLKDTSEYLQIDFNIQAHSRSADESVFVKGDCLEAASVLFDKSNVVRFKDEDYEVDIEYITKKVNEFKVRYTQHSRVVKYCERGLFLEASMYYGKYVADPILIMARFLYTPKYHYLYMLHITDHLPSELVEEIEGYYRYSSVEDIRSNLNRSTSTFNRLLNALQSKYDLKIN